MESLNFRRPQLALGAFDRSLCWSLGKSVQVLMCTNGQRKDLYTLSKLQVVSQDVMKLRNAIAQLTVVGQDTFLSLTGCQLSVVDTK